MIGRIIIDGINSADYGVFVTDAGVYDAPARQVEKYTIPGKSGDLTIDKETFGNVQVKYPGFVIENMAEAVKWWRNFLLSGSGYHRIEDSFREGEYRLGMFSGDFNINKISKGPGTFTLIFDCKPQRYLIDGEFPISLLSNTQIINRTEFPSLPLIRVYGYGTLDVGSIRITIDDPGTPYVDIDCEMMNCYYGTINKNSFVSGDFPKLKPGSNGIAFNGNITKVEITPRWWII